MANETKLVDETKEAILDNEHSIGEKVPGTPFALVALSYLLVLILACGAFALFMWAT